MPWSAEMGRRKAPLGERLKQAWRALRGQTAVAEIATDPHSEIYVDQKRMGMPLLSAEWYCREDTTDLAKRSIAGQIAREAEKQVSFSVLEDPFEETGYRIVRGELYIVKPEEGWPHVEETAEKPQEHPKDATGR